MSSSVYLVTHDATGRHYVGKANDAKARWRDHRRDGVKGPKVGRFSKLHSALHKHGSAAFTFQVLETFDTESDAFAAEVFWIGFLRTTVRGYGFNLDGGGVGGKTRSAETVEKIRLAALANPQRYWLGKSHSAATRARIGETSKGRKWTPEQRAKMLVSRRAAWERLTPEQKKARVEKQTAGHRGVKHGPQTEEHKKKISDAHLANPQPKEKCRERALRSWATRRAREAALRG